MRRYEVVIVSLAAVLATRCVAAPTQNPSGESATEAGPSEALVQDLYRLGIETCDQGRWSEALPIHEKLTVLDPDFGFGWMGLGWSRQYSGDPNGAIPAYERANALGAMPRSRILQQIAECHAQAGRLPAALDVLSKAVDAGLPNLPRVLRSDALRPLLENDSTAVRMRELLNDVDVAALSRVEGWKTDLRILRKEARRMLYSSDRVLPAVGFDARLADLERRIESSSDEQMEVDVMELITSLGDGHTLAAPGEESLVPVLFMKFSDGWFVTGTDEANRALVWSRIDAIEGMPPDAMLEQVGRVVSRDNAMRPLAKGPERMRSPRVLRGLGLGGEGDTLLFDCTAFDGKRVQARVAATRSIGDIVRSPAGHEGRPPRHAARRSELYWFERCPDAPIIYFGYNGCDELLDRPLDAFAAELIHAVEQPEIQALVVDLRWNGGGNMFTSRPLVDAILRCRKLAEPGRLFVIAGRHTFSAAILFAVQLERYADAIFVGEPTGASPNFVGETNMSTLPFSKMRVSFSNLYWQTSTAQDLRPWIAPKIRTPMSFRTWREGGDESMDAIIAYLRRASRKP